MTAAVTVRAFRLDDSARLEALAREMAVDLDDTPPSLPADVLRAMALGPDPWCQILVAELAGELVGFAAIARRFDLHCGARILFLSDLHVTLPARRHRVARSLMAAVGQRALELGCARVEWGLWTLNERGRAFYKAIGAVWEDDIQSLKIAPERLVALVPQPG